MRPTLTDSPIYSVVIIKEEGIMSRAHGTDLEDAIEHAKECREDFPQAEEVRVVSATGVHFTC